MFFDRFFTLRVWGRYVERLFIHWVLLKVLESSIDLEIDRIFFERF
jgi:ABC-type transport system involved in cytochrome bd biosynthesis fused ATPase/permease subunit